MRKELRKARVARKMSHDQVAKELGVARATYASWEAGASSPSKVETIAAILRQLVGRSDIADELEHYFRDDGEESINGILAKYPPARIPDTSKFYGGRAHILSKRRTDTERDDIDAPADR